MELIMVIVTMLAVYLVGENRALSVIITPRNTESVLVGTSGNAVTKPISYIILFSQFCSNIETLFTYWTSHPYLTGLPQLSCGHPFNHINVIQRIYFTFWLNKIVPNTFHYCSFSNPSPGNVVSLRRCFLCPLTGDTNIFLFEVISTGVSEIDVWCLERHPGIQVECCMYTFGIKSKCWDDSVNSTLKWNSQVW